MRLKSISYNQFEGEPDQWTLEKFSLVNINLLVGKNATGKSRTLSVIKSLGNLVAGDIKLQFRSGNYEVKFDKANEPITYFLKYKDSKVVTEKLIIGSKIRLDRGLNGEGSIWSEEYKRDMKFQAPDSELACVNRRDSIQHPFFEDLYQWGKGLRTYYFGQKMGQGQFLMPKKEGDEYQINLKNTNLAIEIFYDGEKKFGHAFTESIICDMRAIGFEIDEINIGLPSSLTIKSLFGEKPQVFILKESDLPGDTDQYSISQGMFRAFSLIIQMNYSQLDSIPSCILIDDIGEGLDYDRSTALIKLIIEKAKTSSTQLIMSTNDRFVMNNVPLEYWAVMKRLSNKTKIYNYENAKKKFDDFELTGLSNFDFFSSGLNELYEEDLKKE